MSRSFPRRAYVTRPGDTLIEVLIAMAILGLVITGCMSLMHAGQTMALEGVEHSTAQSVMNSQLNLVRYMRDEFVRANKQPLTQGAQDWTELAVPAYLVPSSIDPLPCSSKRNAFWIQDSLDAAAPGDQVKIQAYTAGAASGLPSAGDGIWLEAQKINNYVDVVAKACWSAIGGGPQQEAKSVMRLFLP